MCHDHMNKQAGTEDFSLFSYVVGQQIHRQARVGKWVACWSHLLASLVDIGEHKF